MSLKIRVEGWIPCVLSICLCICFYLTNRTEIKELLKEGISHVQSSDSLPGFVLWLSMSIVFYIYLLDCTFSSCYSLMCFIYHLILTVKRMIWLLQISKLTLRLIYTLIEGGKRYIWWRTVTRRISHKPPKTSFKNE